MNSSTLPRTRKFSQTYVLSFVVGLLMAGVSLWGLLFPDSLYPTSELRSTYLPNDLVNLFIGLPILFASIWLSQRGVMAGLLLWPGALLYTLYNYTSYIFGLPFNLATIVYLVIVLLCAYVSFYIVRSIDRVAVPELLSGAIPVKASGWVLVVFGVFFAFRAVGIIAPAITNQTPLPASEIGVLIADLVLSVLWIVGGILLLRRMPLGYISGLGLLFAGCMLFVGLIAFLLLQPLLTDAPFVLVDVIVVAVMGLICFIPFGLYLRGTLSKAI